MLTVADHDRNATGMRYVYAVVSRRARGVSVGINLNPNQACNWRCIYCQVPGLTRGQGPEIDLALLEEELRRLLGEIRGGDFLHRRVPEGARRLDDVAFSGNGEPTTSPQFEEAVDRVGRVLRERGEIGAIRLILITNGSRVMREPVRRGLEKLAALGGETWFKLDSATLEGASRIQSVRLDPQRHLARLRLTARLCPTWIQTCLFAWKGAPPSAAERTAYLDALRALARDRVPLKGVLLYGPARRIHQPESDSISALPQAWLCQLAREIEATGVAVQLAEDPSGTPGA
ncbi:MAG: radical SAM protein [Myxococcota bacterium]